MPTGPDRFTIEIQSGLYEGVVETVGEGRYRIGSEIDADIVLLEHDIAPAHLVIGLAGAAARIEALAPGVVLDGVGPLAEGTGVNLRLPAGISIRGIQMRLGQEACASAKPTSDAKARPL